MRVNRVIYGMLVLSLFLGTVYIAQAAGFWSVSGKVNAAGEKVQPTGANVEEIKGWMKLGDVAGAYKVPVEDIVTAFGLPAWTSPDKAIKELESDTFSPANLRTWLQERMSNTVVP